MIIERAADGGFGAWCPDLPGCAALGDTYAECLSEMREAIRLHIDGLRANGDPVPEPTAVGTDTISAA
ncbi:MAG: type II toxin-antitoxin system HicB family antitoxin [Actinocatenispora sp.]